MLLKPFRVLVTSDSAGNNIVEDLGIVIVPVFDYKKAGGGSYNSTNIAEFIAQVSLYIDQLSEFGNAVYQYKDDNWNSFIDGLSAVAPKSVEKHNTVTGYIKLESDSGYYAISTNSTQANSNGALISTWKLYDNNGTLLVSDLSGTTRSGLPFSSPTTVSAWCATIENGKVTSGLSSSVSVSYYAPSPRWYLDTYNTQSVFSQSNFRNWLNGCSDYSKTSPQTITVTWSRPGDGKLLSATFEINVGPGEEESETSEDDGFTGNEGSF